MSFEYSFNLAETITQGAIMSELSQFALYSMNLQGASAMSDITDVIHKDLEDLNHDYDKVKTYLQKYFKELNNPGDTDGFKFPKVKKSILCQMAEDSTIMVFCKRNESEDMDWVYLSIPQKK